MESAIASLVAIVGTLLGAAATYLFQMRTAKQTQQAVREERLWQEQLAAFSAFAAAITDFRKSQNDRWHRERDNPASAEFILARDESYRLRANATAALFRIRLVSEEGTLHDLAQQALSATENIHEAADEQGRAALGQAARLALHNFVVAASAQVRGRN
jgi:hypothetical protein